MIPQFQTAPLQTCHPFDLLMADLFGCAVDDSTPKVEVKETSRELVISAELHGMTSDHVSVDLTDRFLTIRAKREGSTSGNLHRTFPIDFATSADDLKVSLKGGRLKVVVAKMISNQSYRMPVAVG